MNFVTPSGFRDVLSDEALVRERIDNLEETGAVAVDGKVWTARSADGGVIAPGAVVTVERIDGVKLIVAPLRNSEKTAEEETEHA